MSAAAALPLIAGQVKQGAESTANTIATASVPATKAVRHIALGVAASYSAAPAPTTKTITIKRGTTTILVLRHDFTGNAEFLTPLPVGVPADFNEALSVDLEAGGAGITGRVALFFISN